MKKDVHCPLCPNPEQLARLLALQAAFAQVCNALAPVVRETRCWNRVALHHLTYKSLRERFPELGSQMVCNAIYAVSRASRVVYQHPASPFCVRRGQERPLALLQFADNAPVFFDRHTLSLKDGTLSLYTLNGRMRFQLALCAEDEAAFHSSKVTEIMLLRHQPQAFELVFSFGKAQTTPNLDGYAGRVIHRQGPRATETMTFPPYLAVQEAA